MTRYLREDLQNLTPYAVKPQPCRYKLDANESLFPLPEQLRIAIQQELSILTELHQYPDGSSLALRESIANAYSISPDTILCGNGSDELIQLICQGFLSPGDCFLYPDPSFGMYTIYGRYAHGKGIAIPLNTQFDYDIDQWLTGIDQFNPKLVFLCTPNNPTGNQLTKEQIEQVIHHTSGIVIIDAAYAEFGGEDFTQWILQFPNALLLRTASKAFAFAGIRLGYCIGQPELIRDLSVVKAPYNLNRLTQQIGTILFNQQDHFAPIIQKWIALREDLFAQLSKLPELTVYPSGGNFLLIKTEQANALFQYLLEQGILVRSYGAKGALTNCLRLTVGTEEANEQLVRGIIQFFGGDSLA